MSGKHLIVDVNNIIDYEVLEKVENMKVLMDEIITKNKLNVVGEVHKQFEPIGATCLYLLSESHLSCHTYPERRYLAIDLYCCDKNVDFENVLDIIYKFFKGNCWIKKQIIER